MIFLYYIAEKISTVTNASMTLYHKRYNPDKGLDIYDRYPIEYVNWQGGKGASIDKGYSKANDINVWVPYSENEGLSKIPFAIGDIIVKTIVEDDIVKQSDIETDSYNITTLVDNSYGSLNMQHIYIGAK